MPVNTENEFLPYQLCPDCNGSGVDPAHEWDGWDDDGLPPCAKCEGSGLILIPPYPIHDNEAS